MKIILTAALAASLLGGTAAMAQPNDNNRGHGNHGEQNDRKDRKAEDRNANPPPGQVSGAASGAPRAAAPERTADMRQQGPRDRAPAPVQTIQSAPAALDRAADMRQQGPRDRAPAPAQTIQPAPAAPERAADARRQGLDDRNQARARYNQAAPNAQPAPAAPERAAIAQPPYHGDRSQPAARFYQPAPAAPVQQPREAFSGRGQADRMPVQQQSPQPQFQGRNPAMPNNSYAPSQGNRWSRGDRVPDQYRQNQYYVNDWQQHGLRQPPGGYRWVRDDNNDFYLSLIATGIIADTVYRSDRDDRWRQRYSRSYDYNDDVYYQQCRRSPDPGGILAGGLIGGLLGNAAGHGRTGPTIAGVIFGGAVGAALTSNMNCEDRSYAYRTYYIGFNSGRYGERYEWRNPRNNHRGEFRIRSYYNDPYGFRCARFTQVTYIQNRSFNVRGIACRQPDGSWAVVN